MERKAPPPRGFGGPPVANGAQPQPFARRNGPPGAFGAPPVAETTELTAPPPPPQQPHPPQSFGFPAARGPVNTSVSANRRGWKPGRVGGRHDSPLYGNHRKRPPSSSMDSNVSWSGSEIESIGGFGGAHSEQEQVSRLSWASSVAAKDEAPKAPQQDLASAASLFVAPEVQHQRTPPPAAASGEQETKQAARSESTMNIQPPKTPMGKPTQDTDGEISAVQRVRMELSSHASTRAGSRTNSSENVFASTIPPVYDEEKSGPQSCPSTFNNTKQPQFSIDKLRQLRSNELVASKLLPTRQSVNSLMGYVRELQLSEATLRKQLVKTKQHTEEELSQSLSKVSELERTMMEVERDREMARRKLEEQEKLIRDLAAKLKQVEAVKAKVNASSSVDELPPIAEESQAVTEKTVPAEEKEPGTPDMPPLAPSPSAQPPPTQRDQAPLTPVQPKDSSRAAQFGLASPRSPNQPLWDPWASGGATPMKNLPPVFTIGSTSLDPAVASSTSAAPTSAADATTTAPEYELKSVLMSPRRDQGQDEASETGDAVEPVKQNESAVAAQQEFAAQYPGAVFNVEAMPSPPYPQHENLSSAETQDGEYGAQSQEKVPLMKSPVQVVPMAMAPTVTVAPVNDNSFDQQEASYVSAEGTNGAEWNVVHDLHVMQPPVASFPPPAEADPVGDAAKTIDENVTPAVPPSFADQATISPPPQAMSENSALDVATPYNESTQTAQSEQTPTADGENVATTMSSSPPLGSASFQPPPMSGDQPPRPASPAKTESKKVAAEPVSLETLLVDFFTEVDKKRLKMAKVYGKRYAGREKWLFAELTKRYGADKVAALKARYEYGIATTTTNTSSDRNGKQDDHVTKSPDTISKAGRQGHPRHPQFFHPPTPANKADLGAAVSPVPTPNAPSQENNSPNSQPIQKEKEAEAPSSPSQKVSKSNTTPVAGPPPPFPTTQTIGETDSAATANAGPSMTSRPPPLVHQEKPASSFNQPQPPSFQRGMETSNAAPLGLRQRHNASGLSTQAQKNATAEPPIVTLEDLLKELYKNHQPDKLKNVPVVAKQYAGKERELVGLLKGKYGALSVKRLEENLEVLERTHRNRGGKSAAKKRGCFMLTVSLMFWLWVLLYFSFGAVFVSFVVLNAWECRALDNDEQELESSEECVPLKKELETFTYERVADYMSQSHPDACFCSEWKARENALFTNLSGDDLLNLVRLVPFSPDLFGSAWIATVKEQVPSQESYDNYAKPVVDLSLDVGSFVWSSVLELTRYDEASEEKSPIVEEDIADIPSLNEESESNAHTDSPDRAADEMEKEMENESFVNEVEAEDKVTDELYAEEVVVPPEEVPVEVDTFKFDDEPQTGDIEIATKEDMPEEDIIPVDKESAAIKEETFPFTSEAEDDVTSESTDVVESDDPPAIEESEDIPLAKEAALDDTNDVEAEPEDANVESADVYNTEVIETLTVDDAVFASVEETESVNANVEPADVDMAEVTETTPKDDSVLAPVTETEFVDSDDDEFSASTKADAVNAMVDVVEEASDATVEDADNTESLDEENAMESDDVVEVEVLQEGVDLSYTETVSDTNQEELTAESIEIFSSALEDELEPVDIEEDASSELSEAEAEKPVESENVAVESPESETDSAEDTVIIPSIADTVVEVKELSSDADVLTEATDGEMERAEEESVRSEELELNVEPDLNEEEPDTVVVSVDVDEAPVVQSENGDEVASTLSEENEVEVENNELDVVVEVEVETTANNDEGEMSASDEDHGDEEVIVELDSELPSSSNDVDVVEPLSEEGSVGVSNEGAEVANDVSNDEEPVAAPVAVVESLSEDADVKSDEEDAEENGSAIPVEVEASVPQLDLEEVVATVADETVVHELEEALENEASEQKEDLEEGLSASAEIESVVVEGDEEDAVPDSFFENDVESVEVVLDEEADGDAEASTFSAVEEEQSASEVGEFSEQGEESVVIEATEASIEADTDAPDATEDGTEEIEDVENAAFAATEDVETLAGDDTESAIVAEEELPDAVDEAFAVPADEEALEAIDEPAAEDVPELEEAPVIEEPIASIESADEHADITDETEPRQATDESSTTASEEEESGGLASAVNEVLARLVEPFEAAKTAAPEVATEEELA